MFRILSSYLSATVLVAAALLVGACSGSSVLPDLTTAFAETKPELAKPTSPPLALVALRPLAGTTPEFAQALTRELNERSKSRSMALIADATAAAETSLTGAFTVRKVKGATIIDYSWDVLEPNGALRRRVAGSETVTLPKGAKEPWSALPPAAVARIADKAYEGLGTDLPKSSITTASIDKVERKAAKQ